MAAAASPVEVDGRLDEQAWQQATPIPIRYEWFPGDNSPASIETTCLVTFDRRHLYIGFRAKDASPDAIRANLADRDAPFQDDTVGFMLDTFNDGRRAFQFRINARGVQMDAFNSDVDGSEDWAWDAIWDARTAIGADGYTVEVAIPFSSLRFPRTSGAQTWGFLAMRDVPRSTRVRLRSSYTDRNRACLVCQFDKITGFEAITPGRNIEFDPTVTVARTDLRDQFPDGDLRAGDADPQAGLSARWSVTPNLVLSGTLNPDFYQIEADAAQLEVNTRFQLFFPEKRPFFLEGSDFFTTPIEAVFTRTVVDPNWGIKLSGKEGAHGFGVFAAQDNRTGITIPGYEESAFQSLDQHYVSTVFRYRRDLGAGGSTLGAIYAGREGTEGEPYSNRVGGIDGLFRLTPADSIRAQWLSSRTAYPSSVAAEFDQPAEPFTGHAYTFNYNHGTRNWNWGAQSSGNSPEFRADSGFVPQVDLRVYRGNVGYTFLGSTTRWFNQIFIGAGADRSEDWNGDRASWGCDVPIEYSGRWQMSVSYNARLQLGVLSRRAVHAISARTFSGASGRQACFRCTSTRRRAARSTSRTRGRPTRCASARADRSTCSSASKARSTTHGSRSTSPTAACSRPIRHRRACCITSACGRSSGRSCSTRTSSSIRSGTRSPSRSDRSGCSRSCCSATS